MFITSSYESNETCISRTGNWKQKPEFPGFSQIWSGVGLTHSSPNNCEPILVVEVRKRKEHNMNAPRLKPSTSNFSLPPANYILHFWTL